MLTGVGPAGAATSTTSTTGRREPRRPAARRTTQPLRLWIGGDSLAGALGPALGELAGATGVVDDHVDYKVSSGLDHGVRDWPEHAAERDGRATIPKPSCS